MNTEKRDYLYEYVLYFWKKKWLLIGIPVIVAILAFGLSKVTGKGYHGEATFSTGSLNLASLTDPELIEARYSKEFSKLAVEPMERAKVKFTVEGKNRAEAESILNKAGEKYLGEMKQNYADRKKLTLDGMAQNERQIKESKKAYAVMSERLLKDGATLPAESLGQVSDAVSRTEKLISDKESSIIGSKTDLLGFEPPLLVKKDVAPQSNHAKANTIIGFILALFLTVLGLMLAKYMHDARARESVRHD